MNIRIATPYSHLFKDNDLKRQVVSLSDVIEIRGPDQNKGITPSALWHCELSIVRNWQDRHVSYLSSIVEGFSLSGLSLELASFHMPSRYQANDVVDGAFIGQGTPMTEKEMLANVETNARTIRDTLDLFGYRHTSLLVENNNHLRTDAYDVVTTPSFIKQMMDVTGFGLLLDVAHAKITAINTGKSESAYFSQLPLSAVEQIHLSHHGVSGDRAFDAHDALCEEDWDYFRGLLPELPNLKYATIEFYKGSETLIQLLERLRLELAKC